MIDASTKQTTSKSTSTGQSGKSPLDALEELLQNAKSKGGAPGTKLSSPDRPGGNITESTPEKSEKEILAEIEIKKQALKQQEQVLIQQQVVAMQQEASVSPQVKARTQQDQQAAEQKQEKQQVAQEYQIRQLGHTKV